MDKKQFYSLCPSYKKCFYILFIFCFTQSFYPRFRKPLEEEHSTGSVVIKPEVSIVSRTVHDKHDHESQFSQKIVPQQEVLAMDWKLTTTGQFRSDLAVVESVVAEGERDPEYKENFQSGFNKQKKAFDREMKKAKNVDDPYYKKVKQRSMTFRSLVDGYRKAVSSIQDLQEEFEISANDMPQIRANLVYEVYSHMNGGSFLAQHEADQISRSVLSSFVGRKKQDKKEATDYDHTANRELADKVEDIIEKEVKISRLEDELSHIRSSLDASNKERVEVVASLESEAEKNINLSVLLEQHKMKVVEQEQELQDLSDRVSELQAKTNDLFQEKVDMEIMLDRKSQDLVHAREDVGSLEHEIKGLESDVKSLSQSNLDLQVKFDQINAELEREKMSSGELVDDLSNQLESSKRTINSLEDDIETLEKKSSARSNEIALLEESRMSLESELRKAKSDLMFAQDKLESLHEQLKDRSLRYSQAQNSLDMANKEHDLMNKKLTKLKSKKVSAEEESRKIKQELSDHKNKLTSVENEAGMLVAEQEKIRKELESFRNELKESGHSEKIDTDLDMIKSKSKDVSIRLDHSLKDQKSLNHSVHDLEMAARQTRSQADELSDTEGSLVDSINSVKKREGVLTKSVKTLGEANKSLRNKLSRGSKDFIPKAKLVSKKKKEQAQVERRLQTASSRSNLLKKTRQSLLQRANQERQKKVNSEASIALASGDSGNRKALQRDMQQKISGEMELSRITRE